MAEILVSDITTGNIENGTGVFDQLIRAERNHLHEEWAKNRLRGADYARVYSGGLEAIMQQTIIFLLGKQEADKKAEAIDKDVEKGDVEIKLLEQQILTEACNTTLVCNQALKVESDIKLVDNQAAKVLADTAKVLVDTDLVTAQIAKTNKETEVLDEQILIAKAEVALKEKQIEIAEQELYLMKAKAWVEIAKVSNDVTITAPPATITGLMGEEIEKMAAEADLMRQRYISEQGQTEDLTTGTLGKQQLVLSRQADGFLRDAEQKAAKQVTDSFSVQKTADESIPTPAGLTASEITKVLDVLKAGIGVDPAPDCPVVECPE